MAKGQMRSNKEAKKPKKKAPEKPKAGMPSAFSSQTLSGATTAVPAGRKK